MTYDWNSVGNFADDPRLLLTQGNQFRMWGDSSWVLLTYGQSTTKPLATEQVAVNTSTIALVNKGRFTSPTVEFRNTTDLALFDRYKLMSWRDDGLDTDNIWDYEFVVAFFQATLTVTINGVTATSRPFELVMFRDGERYSSDAVTTQINGVINILQTGFSYNHLGRLQLVRNPDTNTGITLTDTTTLTLVQQGDQYDMGNLNPNIEWSAEYNITNIIGGIG